MARPIKYTRAQLFACLEAGLSPKEIAVALGIRHSDYVYTLIKKVTGKPVREQQKYRYSKAA